ncbi:MAG: hypothetical protein PHT95_06555 [Candidatus Omnitrophica bacterium]|nr:hypothetical protein [Candidatus Omnitrophota bacterium]
MKVRRGIGKTTILRSAFAAAFLLSAVLPPSPSYGDAVMPLQKGMCYATWDKETLGSEYSDESLKKLANLGVNYVQIAVTQYQDKPNSTVIKPTEQTSSDVSVRHAIKRAHDVGIKVMLKPHIDLIDRYDGTYCRSDIGFSTEDDWQAWFKNYQKFILHYARMAEKLKVDIFCVGTELEFTTQRSDLWRTMVISEVRKVYSGKLVYAANWDEYSKVEFWNELDYVGIDAYFPLSYNSAPSLDDLKASWKKWMTEIELWQVSVNRPVIFTEIGYTSTSLAPSAPWQVITTGNADPEMQALCYQAFFETVWEQKWLAGVYWWKWDTNTRAGGEHNRNFTPQNKPAERILEAHYKGFKSDRTYAMAK